MKISINEKHEFVFTEVYTGIRMETEEGNQIGICMRDDTFELNVKDQSGFWTWYRVNPVLGTIEVMKR